MDLIFCEENKQERSKLLSPSLFYRNDQRIQFSTRGGGVFNPNKAIASVVLSFSSSKVGKIGYIQIPHINEWIHVGSCEENKQERSKLLSPSLFYRNDQRIQFSTRGGGVFNPNKAIASVVLSFSSSKVGKIGYIQIPHINEWIHVGS